MRHPPPFRARDSLQRVLERRVSRRGLLATGGAVALAPALAAWPADGRAQPGRFEPVTPQRTDALVLPRGYTFDVVARWGDSLFPGTPDLEAARLAQGVLAAPGAAARQARQFGNCCDGTVFFPDAGHRSDRGVLCVNSEYVVLPLMFPLGREPGERFPDRLARYVRANPEAGAVVLEAHGVNVLEVARVRGRWSRLPGAPLTRRITGTTPCEITGPARGAPAMRTGADPSGTRVLGTFANCSSGRTPWGTYLTAEENVDDYFAGADSWARDAGDAAALHRRFPLLERGRYGLEHVDRRFDLRAEPNEPFRFGWIVEIDPHDPRSVPKKRTALGRFSHESATTHVAPDGRVAVYLGDDDPFEYVYKFVTRGRFDPRAPAANRDLLDEGTLHVARFDADGTGEWLPLVHGQGPLTRANGFASQADVVIRARAAADLLGATPMDRPEDVEPDPVTGRVYVACTKNPDRRAASERLERTGRVIEMGRDAANPRGPNPFGHIVEIVEDGDDATALRFRWDILLQAGGPASPRTPLACPDNLGFDRFGRLWIVTDTDDPALPHNGCFVTTTSGPQRGLARQLASGPAGAEVSGCELTPDGTTLFLAIQHPGEGGTIDAPRSHWPDGGALPPRSALVAVRREDGAPV